MEKGENQAKRGFTIIEVSLVLAIAGLIFLMVFIALPALRASQRDTERREAVALVIDAIKKYQSNNRGALPTNWDDFSNKYVSDKLTEPNSGDRYSITQVPCVKTKGVPCELTGGNDIYGESFENMMGKMLVVTAATCDGNQAKGVSNPRKVAVLYHLERGGVYCANS